MTERRLKITLIKSRYGRIPAHRATIKGLGLRRINQVVVRTDTLAIRGMIRSISYLLKVEEFTS